VSDELGTRKRLLLQRSAFIVQSSAVRSLRPCWTAFLSILRDVLLLS